MEALSILNMYFRVNFSEMLRQRECFTQWKALKNAAHRFQVRRQSYFDKCNSSSRY